jgi:hypothetical protein
MGLHNIGACKTDSAGALARFISVEHMVFGNYSRWMKLLSVNEISKASTLFGMWDSHRFWLECIELSRLVLFFSLPPISIVEMHFSPVQSTFSVRYPLVDGTCSDSKSQAIASTIDQLIMDHTATLAFCFAITV